MVTTSVLILKRYKNEIKEEAIPITPALKTDLLTIRLIFLRSSSDKYKAPFSSYSICKYSFLIYYSFFLVGFSSNFNTFLIVSIRVLLYISGLTPSPKYLSSGG